MNRPAHDCIGYRAAICARSTWVASIIAEAFKGWLFLTHGRKISSPRFIGLPLREQNPVFFETARRQS